MESTVMEKPCDVCERETARWFCAADNASLCNRCDAYVHSANAVARRHERKPIGAPKSATSGFLFGGPGYRRRARSNRMRPQRKEKAEAETELATVAVPENDLGDDDDFLPQVPVFVPALAEELCEFRTRDLGEKFYEDNCEPVVVPESDLHQFLNSDTETDLFALDMEGMDVESIIGQGLGDDALGFLGFQNSNFNVKVEDEDRSRVLVQREEEAAEADVVSKVKVELAEQPEFDPEGDQSWDTIEINLDYHEHDEDQELKFANSEGEEMKQQGFEIDLDLAPILGASEKKISLNLNYDDVITAWSDRGSLWVPYDECASDGGGGCGNSFEAGLVPDISLNCAQVGNPPSMINGAGEQDSSRQRGREARVLRYREKRRTRLFSKKIRYEVRKLNAEKRPRMKGRFVKRTSGIVSD